MTSLCTRCALRLQRAAQTPTTPPLTRTLATNPQAFVRGLPTFQPTSNPDLDALLTDFRYKHFLPAALETPQWNLVFRNKNRNFLAENPQAVRIGDETFQLRFLGGHGVMPNRKKQLMQVIRLLKEGEAGDWQNLPNLLKGLHSMTKTPPPQWRAWIIRVATMKGQFPIVIRILQAAEQTGFTLRDPETLHATIWGLRSIADQGEWSEEALAQALKTANEIAAELESAEHWGGRSGHVGKGDARRSSFVLGVFLELNAVYAYRVKGGKDVDGRVRAFAERLLFNMSEADREIDATLPEKGPMLPMRYHAPVLHGLKLANRMLGDSMPEKQKAEAIIESYERLLGRLKQQIEASNRANNTQQAVEKPSVYGEEALRVWQNAVADD